ncbi:MAG: hypothetical protein ACLQQ4_17925 [Bacteroidia bacterium]
MTFKRVFVFFIIIIPLMYGGYRGYVFYEVFHSKKYYESVKHYPQYFCYHLHSGELNPSLYIKDSGQIKKLLAFYSDSNHYLPDPILYLSLYKKIYIIKYVTVDSSVAEFADFDTNCWGYIHGFVYQKELHNVLPPDSLIKKFNGAIQSLEDKPSAKYEKDIRRSSPYGVQCDCD